MRAVVLTEHWDLQVLDVPTPEPAQGEVLVNIIATGICGSDLHGFTGENGRRFPGQVMGHETVGRVAVLGENTAAYGLREGQLVTVNPVIACGKCEACTAGAQQRCPSRRVLGVDPTLSSAFAEVMAAPAGNVVALPESMPFEYGALVEPLTVGYHAAVRGNCSPGDRALIIGGGPIGQATALAALRLGVDSVAVSEPNPARRALLQRLGIASLDPTDGDLTGRVRQLLGGSPTLTLDAVGATSTMADALAVTDLGARIVLVGMHNPRLEVPAYAISTEERSVIGSFCYSAEEFTQTARWVAETDLDLTALIEDRVDLAGTAASFASLARGESQASKVLVYPYGVAITGACAISSAQDSVR